MGDHKDNLYSKMTGQINAVRALGYNVWYTAVDRSEIFIFNGEKLIKIAELPNRNFKLLKQISFYNTFYKSVYKFLIHSDIRFEFAYIRNMFFCVNSVRLLKKLRKDSIKVVMEIPTHPVEDEYRLIRNIFRKNLLLALNRLSKFHSKYVNIYAVIGDQCKEYFGRKAINIKNGIDVENTPVKKTAVNEDEIHILAMATMAKWHGYDRLIQGLYEYYKDGGHKEIFIHMVGNDGDGSFADWKKLALSLDLDKRVIFEGYLTGVNLHSVIDKCDIAVSSLAGHRKNIYITSELKSREYMARGLPFIFSTNDEILENAKGYCFKVSNDDSNIDFNILIDFVDTTRHDPELPGKMRMYALNNMSWGKEFSVILQNLN